MKIISSEIKLPKTDNPSSGYFEKGLSELGYKFIRWAIVKIEEDNFVLNVSHIEQ